MEEILLQIISLEEWKNHKNNILNSQGILKDEIAQKEARGFELCILISDEISNQKLLIQNNTINDLVDELKSLINSLVQDHAYYYFKAFIGYLQVDKEIFSKNFDLFIESEKRLFNKLPDCDWWIDNFMWVLNVPFSGFYSICAQAFEKHFPLNAMRYVCLALDQSESLNDSYDIEMELLFKATQYDKECYIAHYLIANLLSEHDYFKSAIHYYELASRSRLYSQDPSFYFEYAKCAERSNENELALELYGYCGLLDECYPGVINNLGCVYLKINNFEKAISTFNKAINLNLDGILPYRNIIATYEKSRQYQQCLTFINTHKTLLGLADDEIAILKEKYDFLASQPEGFAPSYSIDDESYIYNFKKAAELYIIKNLSSNKKLFGRNLKIFQTESLYGQQCFIKNSGCIDFILENEKESELLIVNFVDSNNIFRSLSKLVNQLEYFNEQSYNKFREINGILINFEKNDELENIIANLNLNIELYYYDFSILKN